MAEHRIRRTYTPVTVLDTAALSGAGDLGDTGEALCGLLVPVSLAATTVGIRFHVSIDNLAFALLQIEDGSAYELVVTVVAAVQPCYVNQNLFKGFRYVKVLTVDAGGADEVQTADKIFTLLGRQ